MNLSSVSDLMSESQISAESYLDWDVIDEMVAILSNRELSTPSTGIWAYHTQFPPSIYLLFVYLCLRTEHIPSSVNIYYHVLVVEW